MDTVQQIAFSFNYSAHRLRIFQVELELDDDAQAGMNNITTLQSLCEIRWFSRPNALYTFKSAFTAVVTTLIYLEEDGDSIARGYLLSIKNVDFIITLVTIEHVLQSLFPLTTFYMRNSVTSANEAITAITAAGESRPRSMECIRFEIEASKPRNDGRHRPHPLECTRLYNGHAQPVLDESNASTVHG